MYDCWKKNYYAHGDLRCEAILPCFSAIFNKGNSFCNFQSASLTDIARTKWGLFWKERICSIRSKFFHLRTGPIEKRGTSEKGRISPPDSAPIYLVSVLSICLPRLWGNKNNLYSPKIWFTKNSTRNQKHVTLLEILPLTEELWNSHKGHRGYLTFSYTIDFYFTEWKPKAVSYTAKVIFFIYALKLQ